MIILLIISRRWYVFFLLGFLPAIYVFTFLDSLLNKKDKVKTIIINGEVNRYIFMRPMHLKSPDLKIRNEIWELKSPTGNSKNTIHNVFVTARRQSYNVIIDLRRCKMHEQKAFFRIREAYNKRRRRKCKLLVINKTGKIVDISEII